MARGSLQVRVVRHDIKPRVRPQFSGNVLRAAFAELAKDIGKRKLIPIGPFADFFPPKFIGASDNYRCGFASDDYRAGIKARMRRNQRAISQDLRPDGQSAALDQGFAYARLIVDAIPVGVVEHGPVLPAERNAHVVDELCILDAQAGVDPDRQIEAAPQ